MGLRSSLLMCVVSAAGCMPDALVINLSPKSELAEQVIDGRRFGSQGKITVIDVDGLIMNGDPGGLLSRGENPVVYLTEQLDKARKDKQVVAVVLRINSPGGSVTASELMYTEVLRFKKSGKPVVAMMLDVAASGGYYIACAADDIMASRSSVTGSIGVIMQTFDLTGTMSKIGARGITIKSGDQKGAGSPFESMTDDQRLVLQEMIDDLHGQFVDVVVAGRPELSRETIEQLADGRAYLAPVALEAGLIDHIGTMQDAIDRAKKRAGLDKVTVVIYHRPTRYKPNYYARHPASATTQVGLLNVDLAAAAPITRPPFMYLWTGP